MDNNLVSVIINTINEDADVLIKAVESYLTQEGVEVQLIISTIEGDDSINILKGYPVEFAVISIVDHPGKSPAGSFIQLNNALPLIRGEWFCFASGNDYAEPFKLRAEVECCLLNKKEVCYSSFYYAYNHTTKRRIERFYDYDIEKHMKGNFVSDCALISRRLVDKYLPFNTDHNNYAFWDLWLRIYTGEGNVFVYNHKPTWNYVQRETDMHAIRRKSQSEIKQAKRDRRIMLSNHLKLIRK